MDMQALVEEWSSYGLIPMIKNSGQQQWRDLCVVDTLQGPTLSCDWLTWDRKDRSVCLRGKPKGIVIGQEEMPERLKNPSEQKTSTDPFKMGIRMQRGSLFASQLRPKPDGFDFAKTEGMLLGLAVGDSLGVTTESKLPAERMARYGEIRSYLPNRYTADGRGYPSDDTQLSFWALEQIIADKKVCPERIAKRFVESGRIFGIGNTVKEFLSNFKAGIPWQKCGPDSAGNGALMRIAPVLVPHLRSGGCALLNDAALLGMITHNSYASNAACVSFAVMLWELLDMKQAPDGEWWLKRYVELSRDLEGETHYKPRDGQFMNYSGPLWRYAQEKVDWAFSRKLSVLEACNAWYSGAYLLETIPSVLYILMRHAHDPEEAIVRAVNDTKDNDTVAAIVGAAVGALHGRSALPQRWINNLSGRTSINDDGKIFKLIDEAKKTFWDIREPNQINNR